MKCNKYQDIIVTDHVDGELAGAPLRELEAHLASCARCREFRDAVVRQAVEPFRTQARAEVPEAVWQRIRSALAQRERKPAPGWGSLLKNFFPRMAVMSASLAAMLFAGSLFFGDKPVPEQALTGAAQQYAATTEEAYFGYFYEDADDSGESGFGTAFEELMM